MPKFIDKTGMTFGSLTVLSRAPNKSKQVYWNCKCACGKICCIRGDRLTESHIDEFGSPSCGCVRSQRAADSVKLDLKDKVIGRLTVLEPLNQRSKNGSVLWRCQCECGNEIIVSTDGLTKKTRPTRSCGCLQKEKAKESLQKYMEEKIPHIGDNIYGFIVKDVKLEPTNTGTNESWIYAECPICGKLDWYKSRAIKLDGKRSCGCQKGSLGELKIKNLLIENNILYEQEKIFPDLKDMGLLRFDFYLPDYNTCIEYDGEQHFKPATFGGQTQEQAEEEFQKLKKRDQLKNDYCLEHKIILIRIPYTYYDKITINDLLPAQN